MGQSKAAQVPFPTLDGNDTQPRILRWWIDNAGQVHLAEVRLFNKKPDRTWDDSWVEVFNPETEEVERFDEGGRVFRSREEALCAAITQALDIEKRAADLIRIYRSAESDRGKGTPIPSDCSDCRGTALRHEETDGRLEMVERGGYCESCRGTGVAISRREFETVAQAQQRIERAFPGTDARKNW